MSVHAARALKYYMRCGMHCCSMLCSIALYCTLLRCTTLQCTVLHSDMFYWLGFLLDNVFHHRVEIWHGLQVLSELRSYRRTNSTEEMDSPMSNPESPGFLMNLRSSSLIALGITPASPHAQRQFIASGKRHFPVNTPGAKQLPQASPEHGVAPAAEENDNGGRGGGGGGSDSRGNRKQRPARVQDGHSIQANEIGGKHRPLPKRRAAADDDDHGGVASKKDGKCLPAGLHDGRSTHASRNGGKHRPPRSPPNRSAVSVRRSNHHHRTDVSEAQSSSNLDSDSSCQTASSSSAQVSSDEEEAQEEDTCQGGREDWVPSPTGKGNLRVGQQRNRQKTSSTQGGEEQDKDGNAPSDEEDWTGSPVTRSKRSLKAKSNLRKSSMSTNPKVLAARRATVGGRKRSDKLSNFSGVTLKNGRCAWLFHSSLCKKLFEISN